MSRPGTLYRGVEIELDGETRYFWYYVPSDLPNTPVPLVLCLHGGGGRPGFSAGAERNSSPAAVWMDIAERDKLIVAYPQGTPRTKGKEKYQWNDCRGDALTHSNADDVRFLDSLITWFENQYSINAERVYSTGISNGGFMSFRLACELSDRIAAIGAITAANPAASDCSAPEFPIAVLIMNGTDDWLVPWEGGPVAGTGERGTVDSTENTVDFWVDFIGADEEPQVAVRPDFNRSDGSTVQVRTYGNGAEGTEVVLYEVDGGGHTEPSIAEHHPMVYLAFVGTQNHDIEAAEEIWSFFQRHTLGTTTP